MNNIELKLLAGLPIHIDGIGEIYAPTMRDIALVGETKYQQMLSAILFDKSKLIDEEKFDPYSDLFSLGIITEANEEFRSVLYESIKFFFKREAFLGATERNVFFVFDDAHAISDSNFDEIKRIIKIQNCLDKIEEDKDNPANDKAREILEKRKKARQKVNKAKSGGDDGEPLTLFDLISILAGSSRQYNLINHENNPMSVWNLTMFQFNDAFNRLKMFNDYEVNIQAILHGAKPEDVELKHWISKIQN